jgi:hypothetical protein
MFKTGEVIVTFFAETDHSHFWSQYMRLLYFQSNKLKKTQIVV